MGGTPKKRKSKTAARRIESDDEPSDGNSSPYARLPSEQRMSKEKQKFFKFSAFNLVKRRRCRESSSEFEGWGGVRVTRVQRLELTVESSPPVPSQPEPTIFERLATDASPDGAWGFAAEARKQRLVESPPKVVPARSPPSPPARHRRRSRCGDRLLTTLFDGLSEFYSVRTASRSQSRHRPVRKNSEDRQVLKETRSTFKRYQASLNREPSDSRPIEDTGCKDAGRDDRSRESESIERVPYEARRAERGRSVRSQSGAEGFGLGGEKLSASALVVRAAEGKRGGAGVCAGAGEDAQQHKLARALGPATNQTGKRGSGAR